MSFSGLSLMYRLSNELPSGGTRGPSDITLDNEIPATTSVTYKYLSHMATNQV